MRRKIILVSDSLQPFHLESGLPVSDDATAEWEDAKTIDSILASWKEAGYQAEALVLERDFFSNFISSIDKKIIVHSLAEGFGTQSREAWIPSLCELAGIPWIGSSPAGFSICMDKDLTSMVARSMQIPSPRGTVATCYSEYIEFIKTIPTEAHFVKPNCEGSGMGVSSSSLRQPISPLSEKEFKDLAQKYPEGLRIEMALSGIEITTALVGKHPEFLPVAQIKVPNEIYGIEHKRKDEMTEEVSFPSLESKCQENLETWSRALWERLSLKDFARFDWKFSTDGIPHLLEINPLAGLSPHYSVLPLMWQKTGRSYGELLHTLAESALSKEGSRALIYGRLRTRPSKQN